MARPAGGPPAIGPAASRRRSAEPCDDMGARPTVDRRAARIVRSSLPPFDPRRAAMEQPDRRLGAMGGAGAGRPRRT